jgi:hypothetical protein
LAAIVVGAAAVPEAVKVTGLPVNPPELAVTVLLLVPAVFPSVQLASVAIPLLLVGIVAGLAGFEEPPPAVTVKTTATPGTPFPLPSVTFTEGGAPTAVPTVAL